MLLRPLPPNGDSSASTSMTSEVVPKSRIASCDACRTVSVCAKLLRVATWWHALGAAVVGLAIVWLLLVLALYVVGRRFDDPARLRDALALLPDVVRLLRRLLSDRDLPAAVRVRVLLLTVYLISPLDFVPDVIPVVGYADDVVVVLLTLRSVARRAGPNALDRHWTGTPERLRALKAMLGIRA
jgi:uncharacterized membrane protein YkvA (DUF1232 family)